jgi:CheY-like chemotaxis protein
MKILVVDDNKSDRELAIKNIKDAGFKEQIEIEESNNLTSAKVKITENQYDLILLDLELPETNGIETVRAIFDTLSTENKKIPIIILTGNKDYRIGKAAFEIGIKDYIVKGDEDKRELRRAINFATYSRNLPLREKSA